MAKKYVCDICGRVIDDPYSAKMREFYLKFVAHHRKNEELQTSKEESKE